METVESISRSKRRRGYLQDAVLATLAASGVIALALVAPNTLQLLGGFSRKRTRFTEESKSAAQRLVKKGYATFEKRNGTTFLTITSEGKRELTRAEVRRGPETPKRWDGRWRLIVFDVPERRRAVRNALRRTVERLGFLKVQNSVWVYPYDCEELIALLKAELRLGKDVLYAIVETIERDRWIRGHFKLK